MSKYNFLLLLGLSKNVTRLLHYQTAFKVACPISFNKKDFPPWWSKTPTDLKEKVKSVPMAAGSTLPERLGFFFPTKGCRPSKLTLPCAMHFTPRLSSQEQYLPASLLSTLLLRAGIESNPGPEVFHCCVCQRRLHPNATSVRCNACDGWCHLNTCSGMRSHREWSTNFVATCCSRPMASTAYTAYPGNVLPSSSTVYTSSVRNSEQHNSLPTTTPPQPPSRTNNRARNNQQLLVPRTICSVCHIRVPRNLTSVKCNSCNGWCHFRRCSGLRTTRDWTQGFIAPCCRAQLPQQQNLARPPNTFRPQRHLRNAQREPHSQQHASLTPRNTTTAPRSFKLLQLNANGLSSKVDEIVDFMSRHGIPIAAVQETKLHAGSSLITRDGYNVHRKDRERDNGGGLAFIVHHSVQYRLIDESTDRRDSTLECQGIAVRTGGAELEIFNIYIPPVTCCPTGYHPDISALLNGENRLVVGDFNAHHDLWHSSLPNDRRGHILAEQIDDSTFSTVNDDAPTRIVGNCSSSPDLTIASAGLINSITWRPMLSLASDHLPIVVSIERPADFVSANHRSYINFNKANWAGFTEFTEDIFAALPIPHNVRSGESAFRKAITAAAARFIPAGRIKDIRPNFPAEAVVLANERDRLRQADPGDSRIRELNLEIRQLVSEHKRIKWAEHLKTCNFATGVSKLWSTVRSLSNPTKHNDRVAITFNGCTTSDPERCASYFNRQFILHPPVDRSKRRATRKLHKLPNNCEALAFSSDEVKVAIKKAKASKAIGPDGLNMLMLKHLGPLGVEYLTKVFNLSLATLIIPDKWKAGRVVPLLKPGKPANQGESYRPITLLSPVVKTLEALLLPTYTKHLTPATHQHGFRRVHSTTTALTAINTRINRGLNQNRPCERTILVALDLKKAFDTVSHSTLLDDILQSTLPSGLKRWSANYLSGRHSSVIFRDKISKQRRIKQGVPQGGVLSPLLFNFYISKLPQPPEGISIVSYADDCSIMASGNDIDGLCSKVNDYLTDLSRFFTARDLQLSPTKSTATLFTTWTKEVKLQLQVKVDDTPIPTVNNPKILGVTFDSLLSFSAHTTAIVTKVQNRNKVLKSLAGSTWGKDKETLLSTFKAIGRPILNYAAPVWSPGTSDTQWTKLQTCQNTALRTATGCLLMSPVQHLHNESEMLPVKEHNKMISKQFLLGCYRRYHPCSHLLEPEPPPRHVRRHLFSWKTEIQDKTQRQLLDLTVYRQTLNDIHRETVNTFLNSRAPNAVIRAQPPPIADEELQLPRETRVTLAQLRSGYCSRLNSYLSRIDPDILNICPACEGTPHDTNHLFTCPLKPTHLTPTSLWTQPVETACFLGLPLDELDEDDR